MVNHCEGYGNFLGIGYQFQGNILCIHHFHQIINILTHLKSFTGNFSDIAPPYKLFTSQYLRYDDFLFLSQSLMYLLLAFASR